MVKVFNLIFVVLLTGLAGGVSAQVTTNDSSYVQVQEDYQKLAQVEVRLRPNKVQLGDSVTFVVKGEHIKGSISKIDLAVFSKDFVIDDVQQQSDLLRVKMYPLRSGDFILAGQQAGNLHIPEFHVQVTENPQVSVQWQSPKPVLYSQQIVSWRASVQVQDSTFKVLYNTQQHNKNQDIEVSLAEQSVSRAELDSGAIHQLVAAYAMPGYLKAERKTLYSPVVEVKNFSNKRWKFFDASKQIQIKPLPSFLPLSASVGVIDWQVEPNGWVYQAGKLHYWKWHLSVENLSVDYLKSAAYQLLGQLANAENIHFLSESMESEQDFNEQGMVSSLEINIPYRVESAGWTHFPELSLRYFDPNSGRVEQLRTDGHLAFGLPSWLIWILQWLVLTVALVSLFALLLLIKQSWQNRRFKLAIKQALREENAGAAVWRSMLEWQLAHRDWKINWRGLTNGNKPFWQRILLTVEPHPSKGSFQQWQDWYQSFYANSAELDELMAALNTHFYAQTHTKDLSVQTQTTDERIRLAAQAWINVI